MNDNAKEVIKPSKVNQLNHVHVVGVVLIVIVVVFFFEICYNGIDKMYRRGS